MSVSTQTDETGGETGGEGADGGSKGEAISLDATAPCAPTDAPGVSEEAAYDAAERLFQLSTDSEHAGNQLQGLDRGADSDTNSANTELQNDVESSSVSHGMYPLDGMWMTPCQAVQYGHMIARVAGHGKGPPFANLCVYNGRSWEKSADSFKEATGGVGFWGPLSTATKAVYELYAYLRPTGYEEAQRFDLFCVSRYGYTSTWPILSHLLSELAYDLNATVRCLEPELVFGTPFLVAHFVSNCLGIDIFERCRMYKPPLGFMNLMMSFLPKCVSDFEEKFEINEMDGDWYMRIAHRQAYSYLVHIVLRGSVHFAFPGIGLTEVMQGFTIVHPIGYWMRMVDYRVMHMTCAPSVLTIAI